MDGVSWNNWSPAEDWGEIFCNVDDFQMLMEEEEGEPCNNSDSIIMTNGDREVLEANHVDGDAHFKGLRLVHLLTAAAEALSGKAESHHLAGVILTRLKEIVSSNSLTQRTNMERLAAHFTEALQGLLKGNHHKTVQSAPIHHHRPTDSAVAFQLTQDMSPYVKFGHFTANQAILEAVIASKRVHVVDYDIMEGIQWASLMQALASRPAAPHLRITALSRCGSGLWSIGSTVQETGRRLTSFAESIGLSFSFHQCRLEPDETFWPSSLKRSTDESLVFNFMLHLSHSNFRSLPSIAAVFLGAKALKPQLITVVEDEVGFSPSFIGRFLDSLHHYSAIYDSLDCGFPIQEQARALVERVFLGPKIAGTLGRIYGAGDEAGSWADRVKLFGFEPVPISFSNHCQAKLLLGLFNDGYRVEELPTNRLVLSWKSRQLLGATIWTC